MLVAVAASFVGCSAGSDGADQCRALLTCCHKLAAPTSSACVTQHDQAAATSNAQLACSDLLKGYVADGLCSAATTPADGGAVGDGSVVAESCTLYINCVSMLDPSLFGATLSTYGPDGSCWSSGATIAADCVAAACRQAIAQLTGANPGASCPVCASDADCAAPAGVCELSSGQCVACTKSASCTNASQPVCDSASNTCVACVTDNDCTSSAAPACDSVTRSCVACTASHACPSAGVCLANSCCTPATACPAGSNCGTYVDACQVSHSCGTCQIGSCVDNTCSSAGQPCSTASTCASGEACLYDAWSEQTVCSPTTLASQSCMQYGMNPSSCTYTATNGNPVDTYQCQIATCASSGWCSGTCYQNCLQTTDCPAGTCHAFNSEPINTTTPGICY